MQQRHIIILIISSMISELWTQFMFQERGNRGNFLLFLVEMGNLMQFDVYCLMGELGFTYCWGI